MDNLSVSMFVIPMVALALVTGFYFYYATHVTSRATYHHLLVRLTITGFVLNFVWELLHGPLYKDFEYDLWHILICTLASIADMLMVLLLFFAFSIGTNDPYWIKRISISSSSVLIVFGGVGAIFLEMLHTSRGDWQYTDEMPLFPLLDVGLTPILQFMILPWLSFLLTKKSISNWGGL